LGILRPANLGYHKIPVEDRRRLLKFNDFLDKLKLEGRDCSEADALQQELCPDFLELMAKIYVPMFPGDSVDKYVKRKLAADRIQNLLTSSSFLNPVRKEVAVGKKKRRRASNGGGRKDLFRTWLT
jgi:hypothetical protein